MDRKFRRGESRYRLDYLDIVGEKDDEEIYRIDKMFLEWIMDR